MLDVRNDVARTQPTTPVAEAELQSDLAEVASSQVSGSGLDDLRRSHAEMYSSVMLGRADLNPVDQVQQSFSLPGGDVSVTADVTRGINGQASFNASMSAAQMRALGFSEDAIARTGELVKHHTVAGSGSTAVDAEQSQEQPEANAVGAEIAAPIALADQEQQSLATEVEQPLAQAEELRIDEYMADLEAQVAADPEFNRARELLGEMSAREELSDPLANSPHMIEVEVDQAIDQQEADRLEVTQAQASGLTASTGSRLDLGLAADREPVAIAQEVATAPAGLRFDYQDAVAVSNDRDEMPIGMRQNAPRLDEELAQANTVEAVGPFKLRGSSEVGTVSRRGDKRVTVLAAA